MLLGLVCTLVRLGGKDAIAPLSGCGLLKPTKRFTCGFLCSLIFVTGTNMLDEVEVHFAEVLLEEQAFCLSNESDLFRRLTKLLSG